MKIDFYVLDTESSQKTLRFACQLLDELYAERRRRIVVHLKAQEDAARFDALLWTYRDDSFLPHQIYDSNDEDPVDILISDHAAPESHQDILLNLGEDIPSFHKQFQQVIEIVYSDPHAQQLARERYKQYRQMGYDINTIKLKANES